VVDYACTLKKIPIPDLGTIVVRVFGCLSPGRYHVSKKSDFGVDDYRQSMVDRFIDQRIIGFFNFRVFQ